VKEARCIDTARLSAVAGAPVRAAQKGNRPECACFEARDIGEYDTCPHGCVYCYAVRNRPLAQRRYAQHDPASEFLFPPLNPPTTNPALMNHFRSSCLSSPQSGEAGSPASACAGWASQPPKGQGATVAQTVARSSGGLQIDATGKGEARASRRLRVSAARLQARHQGRNRRRAPFRTPRRLLRARRGAPAHATPVRVRALPARRRSCSSPVPARPRGAFSRTRADELRRASCRAVMTRPPDSRARVEITRAAPLLLFAGNRMSVALRRWVQTKGENFQHRRLMDQPQGSGQSERGSLGESLPPGRRREFDDATRSHGDVRRSGCPGRTLMEGRITRRLQITSIVTVGAPLAMLAFPKIRTHVREQRTFARREQNRRRARADRINAMGPRGPFDLVGHTLIHYEEFVPGSLVGADNWIVPLS
jgi:hypothetical protein